MCTFCQTDTTDFLSVSVANVWQLGFISFSFFTGNQMLLLKLARWPWESLRTTLSPGIGYCCKSVHSALAQEQNVLDPFKRLLWYVYVLYTSLSLLFLERINHLCNYLNSNSYHGWNVEEWCSLGNLKICNNTTERSQTECSKIVLQLLICWIPSLSSGLVIAMVVSLIFIVLLRFLAGIMVWVMIVLVILVIGYGESSSFENDKVAYIEIKK